MVNIKKIFGLAGSAIVFAGMAFGQATCSGPASSANFVPVEATAAQVAQLTFTCTGATAGAQMNVQVFLSPTLPITSKITTASSNTTEAVASVGAIAAGVAATGSVQGVLTGNSLTFTGITLAAGSNVITISNVRVNASSVAVGNGVPPAIQETPFISGAGVVPVALGSTTVAFVQSGISSKAISGKSTINFTTGAITTTSTTNQSFVVCNAFSPASSVAGSLLTVLQINENYATAFRAASEAPQVNTIGATAISNAVANNDRFRVTFTNVPSNVTLYVPVSAIPSINGAGAATLQLTSAETGAFAAVTASTTTAAIPASTVYGGGLAPVSVSGGTGTAVFDLRTEDINNLDQFNIPVFIVTTKNSVAGSTTPISATVSYAPVGATTIPNFVIGSSTTTLTAGTFNLCTTSLLFPFVTNQLGFDTGIAISNTSTDPFGTNGATAQAGTCTLNFYGAGAPSPANVTTPNVPSGTTFTQVLSGVAAGFQGYMIAQCGFQFAHGFAFITDGVGANGGLSQGYLAGVIPDVNQVSRAASPLSVAAAGTGETLGN